MEIFLLITLIYFFTFIVGEILEKIRIPWIFSSLLLGFIFSFFPVNFPSSFLFLASLGMYLLFFMIGFEIDLKEIKKESRFIIKSTFGIIFFETLFGTLLIKFLFGLPLLICFLLSLSFATVGEAILFPILDEFRIVNKKLGKAIISIGVLDDIIEIFALVLAASLVGFSVSSISQTSKFLIVLVLLFLSTLIFTKIKKEGRKFKNFPIETLFLFSLFVLFLFLSIGNEGDLKGLAALLAGISLKNFLPRERIKLIENEIKAICYGFAAPLFFFWVGKTVSLSYVFLNPLLLTIFFVVPAFTKIFASYLIGRNYLGKKGSILLGIGLCVRFSTSIVILKYLFEKSMIPNTLYSILVTSTALFTLTIPITFSFLLRKWKI